jgi:hypothetical protein
MKSTITKICVICQQPFHPDRRTERRQTVCEQAACRLQRKQNAQQQWCQNNPGYFKGRYHELKSHIQARRQACQRAAAAKPSRIQKMTGIQDELTHNKNNHLKIEIFLQDKLIHEFSIT